MVYFFEICLALWLVVCSQKILRYGLAANLVALGRWGISFCAGAATTCIVARLAWRHMDNFFAELLFAYLTGAAVFGLAAWFLGRYARRHRWDARSAAALNVPRWCSRLLRVALLAMVWGGGLVVGSVVLDLGLHLLAPLPNRSATAARLKESSRDAIALRQSTAPRFNFAAGTFAATADETEQVRSAMLHQESTLAPITRGWTSLKANCYRATGADELVDQVDAVREIIGLPVEEKLWLLKQYPKIAQLVDHPAVQRIAGNERLIDQLQRARDGSLKAMYQIGEDPDVRKLLEDPRVLEIAREIKPLTMLRQVRRHRENLRIIQSPVPRAKVARSAAKTPSLD
ncbi:MAG: hypothetical protein K8T25_21885 [Planctomycetia bacterium]|nr:hypothetical protein [Planctomycetia bacterium]